VVIECRNFSKNNAMLLADKGILKIDRIGVVSGFFYTIRQKDSIGIHTLAPQADTINPANPAKYADTAVTYAIKLFEKEGAAPPYTVAVAGGATMAGSPAGTNVGLKVAEAAKAALAKAKFNIKTDQTGGSNIRSMILNIDTGEIQIK
jgi:chemotaxis receptor (MCP) glutamine deamidase CheD